MKAAVALLFVLAILVLYTHAFAPFTINTNSHTAATFRTPSSSCNHRYGLISREQCFVPDASGGASNTRISMSTTTTSTSTSTSADAKAKITIAKQVFVWVWFAIFSSPHLSLQILNVHAHMRILIHA